VAVDVAELVREVLLTNRIDDDRAGVRRHNGATVIQIGGRRRYVRVLEQQIRDAIYARSDVELRYPDLAPAIDAALVSILRKHRRPRRLVELERALLGNEWP
jgi:hypothetical protein